jgi:choline dehydrogenase
MMEADDGASIIDLRARNGKRQSVFRSYVFPYIDRSNLTIFVEALVTRVIFQGKRATGVEIYHGGTTREIHAGLEVVLSLGAINTPKVLMQSGLGDQTELVKLGIPVIQHLRGVGQNFQDHVGFDCVWEYLEALPRTIRCHRRSFSRKAGRGSILQTCLRAKLKFRCPPTKTPGCLACRMRAGLCARVSRIRRAGVDCV